MANLPLSLDLTDAIAWQCASKTPVALSSKVPAALLPLHPTEPVLSGPAAENHRRGSGRHWPHEAQVPVRHAHANGTGRIPLASAWARLVASESSGLLSHSAFSWSPTPDISIDVSTVALIAQAIRGWGRTPEVFVTPDGLGPAGQQALLDAFDSPPKLIPVSIAAAVGWCRGRSAPEILAHQAAPLDGKRCGHLRVFHAGFGRWHASLIPIHATLHAGKVVLVPVFSRRLIIPDLGFSGASLLGDDAALSRHIIAPWVGDIRIASSEESRNNCRMDAWAPLTESADILTSLRREFATMQRLAGADSCLGTLVFGTFAETAKQLLRQTGHAGTFLKSEPGAPALGASLALAAFLQNEPAWSEQLDPLDFHCLGKDDFGDPCEDWKALVEASTARAWQEFAPKPITGLAVPAGHDKLTLTLRTSMGDGVEYRDIKATLPRPPEKSEPVVLHVRINPGQGFSRVRVESLEPNLFHSHLDWKRMNKVEKPKPPTLGYIPRSVILQGHRTLWQNCLPKFTTFLGKSTAQLAFDCSAKDITTWLNKWPKADDYERRFGTGDHKSNLYLFYSAIGSDGKLPARTPAHERELWQSVCARSMELLQSPRFDSQAQKALLRMLAWSYASAPDYVVRLAEKHLAEGTAQDIDLHTAGLCFRSQKQIRLFWKSAAIALHSERPPNHWLRACRNITRLNEHALGPEHLDDALAASLAKCLLNHLERGLDNRRPLIAGNAFEALLHLLKRRRYARDFLSGECPIRRRLESRLCEFNLGLPRRHLEMWPNFLKLLRSEASEADLATLVLSDDDDDGN